MVNVVKDEVTFTVQCNTAEQLNMNLNAMLYTMTQPKGEVKHIVTSLFRAMLVAIILPYIAIQTILT